MSDARHRLALAVLVSVFVNAALLGIASLLSSDRGLPQETVDASSISLVTLDPPEPPQEKEAPPPDKPEPTPPSDFKPDLVQPDLLSPGAFDGGGIAIGFNGIGGEGLNDEFVFESYELDQPPTAIVKSQPTYPRRAQEQGIEGVVQVKILVDDHGNVGEVQIMAARPEGVFEEAALEAVARWRFRPGTIENKAVTAWVSTALHFQLN